jgi:hypothetical protein
MKTKYMNIALLLSCALITHSAMGMQGTSSATSSSSSTSSTATTADVDSIAESLSSLSTASTYAPLTGRPTALLTADNDGDAEIAEIVIEKTPLQQLIESRKFAEASQFINTMTPVQIASEYISSLRKTAKNIKFIGTTKQKEERAKLVEQLKALKGEDSPSSDSTSPRSEEDDYKGRTSKKDQSPKRRGRSASPKR